MNKDEKIDLQTLLSRLEEAVAEAPQNAALRNLYGRALLTAGRAEEAAKAYRKALELGCREESCYSELSFAERISGNETAANRVLKDGWELLPESVTLPLLLYGAYAARTNYRAAVSVMDRAIGAHPEMYKLRHAKIAALLRDGRLDAAADYVDSLAEDFADEREYVYDKADVLLRKNAVQEALDLLKEKETSCNSEGRMYLALLSRCYRALADEENTERTLQKLYALFPDRQTAIALAGFCMKRGDFDQARSYLKDVEAERDGSVEYYGARFLSATARLAENNTAGEVQLRVLIDEIEADVQAHPRRFIPLQYAAEAYRLLGNERKAAECEAHVQTMSRELETQIDAL